MLRDPRPHPYVGKIACNKNTTPYLEVVVFIKGVGVAKEVQLFPDKGLA